MSEDTFSICGIDGWEIMHRKRKTGGQQAGIPPAKIAVVHDDLGIGVAVTARSQMKARDLAILAAASVIENELMFTGRERREEVKRLTNKENFKKDKKDTYYEF